MKIRKEVKIMDFGNIINTIGNAINIVTNLIENTKIVEVLQIGLKIHLIWAKLLVMTEILQLLTKLKK